MDHQKPPSKTKTRQEALKLRGAQPTTYEVEAPFPTNAIIELTNACNHACVFCKSAVQTRKASYLDIGVYRKFVEQAVPLGLTELGLYATGEPFMAKNLEKFISVAKNAGVHRVYLSTNGALASLERVKASVDAGLDSIKFSINAANVQDYAMVHGHNDFEKVLKNVKDIFNWKKINGIPLEMLGSCIRIPSLPNLFKEHDLVFGMYLDEVDYLDSHSQGGQAFDIPLPKSELSGVFNFYKSIPDGDNINPCSNLWDRYHLTAEGFLSACCVDYDLNLVFGDMKNGELQNHWNGEIMKKLRVSHLESDLKETLCNQCLRNNKCSYKPISDVVASRRKNKSLEDSIEKLKDRITDIGV